MVARTDSMKRRDNEAATEAAYAALAAAMLLEEANEKLFAVQSPIIVSPIDVNDYKEEKNPVQEYELKNPVKSTITKSEKQYKMKQEKKKGRKDNASVSHNGTMDKDAAYGSVGELKNSHTMGTTTSPKPNRIKSKVSKILSNERVIDMTTQQEDVSDKDHSTGSVIRPSMTIKKPVVTTSRKKLSQRKPATICFQGVDLGNGRVSVVQKKSASTIYEVAQSPGISKEKDDGTRTKSEICRIAASHSVATSIVPPARTSFLESSNEFELKGDYPTPGFQHTSYEQSASSYNDFFAFLDAKRGDIEKGNGETNVVIHDDNCSHGDESTKTDLVNNIKNLNDVEKCPDFDLVKYDQAEEQDKSPEFVQPPLFKNKIIFLGVAVFLLVIGAAVGISFWLRPDPLLEETTNTFPGLNETESDPPSSIFLSTSTPFNESSIDQSGSDHELSPDKDKESQPENDWIHNETNIPDSGASSDVPTTTLNPSNETIYDASYGQDSFSDAASDSLGPPTPHQPPI
jgi:hypothetical protein